MVDVNCGCRCRADLGTGVRPDIGTVVLHRKDGTCGGVWVGEVRALARCGEWCGLPNPCCRQCGFYACHAYLISTKKRTKVVFDQKPMVGRGEQKVAFDKSGFRAYCVDVDWGVNFLFALPAISWY